MTNEETVKIICKIMNLSISNAFPINESGERTDQDFDKRFILDRTYQHEFFNFKKRIRFVKYPNDNYVSVFINNMFVSGIEKTIEGRRIKSSDRQEKVTLDEIEKYYKIIQRNYKIQKIKLRC